MTRLSLEELITRLSVRRARELELPVPIRWAAVSAILRHRGQDDWELLFIKRARHDKDPWSGHMAFPGGRLEPGEDPYAAAIRETLEEVGIDLSRAARLVAQLDDLQAVARGKRQPLVIRPFVFVLETHPELIPNEEVDEVVWIPLSTLLDGEGRGVYHYDRDGVSLELPCVRYQGYLIWGLTHHMMSEMLDRLEALPEPAGPDEGVL
jgi:8-oxo-dGTP pyrophosphatase MutT (NUDIX family)